MLFATKMTFTVPGGCLLKQFVHVKAVDGPRADVTDQ